MSGRVIVAIDSSHCRAICDEIGERLRFSHFKLLTELPIRLQELLDRLGEQELEDSPSIAPFITELSSGAPLVHETRYVTKDKNENFASRPVVADGSQTRQNQIQQLFEKLDAAG